VTSYSPPVEIYRAHWRKVWADLWAGKIQVRQVLARRGASDRVGMPAVCLDQGYRADGSYRYSALDNRVDRSAPSRLPVRAHAQPRAAGRRPLRLGRGRVGENRSRSSTASSISARSVASTSSASPPPQPHAVCAAMQALGDKYAYAPKVHAALQARLAARDFEYYDFSDFAIVQAPDDEAIDGFHGSERTYLRLVIQMLEHGSRLNNVADLPHLREVLRASTTQDELPYGR